MDIWDAIRQRRAVRKYRSQNVSEFTLRRLIEAGSWAPSAMNGQPWHFVVITDASLLARTSDGAKHWMLQNDPLAAKDEHLRNVLGDPQYQVLHGAPALIVITATRYQRWARESCSLAAENMMLAATALGLGTCWIGLAEGWLNSAEGHLALGLPADDGVIGAIAVGYPLAVPAPVARRIPSITWIGPEEGCMREDGEPAELPMGQGVYGSRVSSP